MDDARFPNPLSEPEPVKFITAFTYSSQAALAEALSAFQKQFGAIDVESLSFEFVHTRYYEKEMGPNLNKKFCSFRDLCSKESLIDRKLFALRLESEFANDGKRTINIDPAYLELAKLVVASSKNFSHRIYLGKGIYGDLQLRYKDNAFVPQEWTYPDYATPLASDFFERVREIYSQQLKQ